MAKKKAKRTAVGRPLTPRMLRQELGGLDELASTPEDFKPDGSWINTYRIWTCHGYIESGNQSVGFLRIERIAGKAKEQFTLKVHQEVIQTDRILSTIDAEVKCLNNELASPIQWRLSSWFTGADGNIRNELSTDEQAVVRGDTVHIDTADRTVKRRISNPVTSDWGLFEVIQRLEYKKEVKLAFGLLDGLSVLKEGQILVYSGNLAKAPGEGMIRHCFVQTGRGILPSEYWVDEKHRLQVVCSMNKAYILDDNAEKTIGRVVEQMRK